MPRLRKLNVKEFHLFEKEIINFYAEQSVQSGRIPEETALEWSTNEVKTHLPEGINTANNLFYVIEKDESKMPAGYIWCAQNDNYKTRAYLLAIFVTEKYRNQGLGTKAMVLLEDILKDGGFKGVDLHVYAFNEAAVHIYQKLGYDVKSLVMGKKF